MEECKTIMKILVSTKHGPLNSKPIFEAFIHSLKSSGEQVFVDENIEADVCVIWSVLWFGRMSVSYTHLTLPTIRSV